MKRSRSWSFWASLLLTLSFSGSCFAHDFGCDSKPVPKEIKAGCCGPADYHRLKEDAWFEDSQGNYVVTEGEWTFHVERDKVLPPPDGCPAIFYDSSLRGIDGAPLVWCVFLPFSF